MHATARWIGLYTLLGVVAFVALLGLIRYMQVRADRRRFPTAVARDKKS